MKRGIIALVAIAAISALIEACVNFEDMPSTGQPFVSVSVDKNYGEAPLSVSFTVTAIPARGSISKLIIDYGDGTQEDILKNLKENIAYASHTYQTIGTFKVRVSAFDKNGSSSAELQITTNDKPLISNLKAYTDYTYTKEATEFMPDSDVPIKATCIDSQGIGSVIIDWGDGVIEEGFGCTSSHRYSKEGVYTIKMTVYDKPLNAPYSLTNTASLTVNIRYGIKPGNVPPDIKIQAENTEGEAPLNVTLYVGVSDSDGSISEVKVDWGDGNAENLGAGDRIGIRDGRTIYKKTHNYSTPGRFQITVIAKDDKGDISFVIANVDAISKKPVLAVTFRDHLGQDPNGKTYSINMTVSSSHPSQATISADLVAYDIGSYDIVKVTRRDYEDNSTWISITVNDGLSDLYINHEYGKMEFDPDSIESSPKYPYTNAYPDGITVRVTITIYALKADVPGVVSRNCLSHFFGSPDPDWSEECDEIIRRIKAEPSQVSYETKFTVKPR